MAEITSDFALLDVKEYRDELRKRLDSGERIRIVISGFLETSPGSTGRDDGVSREFQVNVAEVDLTTMTPPRAV